jgi:hypothetical protein
MKYIIFGLLLFSHTLFAETAPIIYQFSSPLVKTNNKDVSITQADSTHDGYLSSANFNIFSMGILPSQSGQSGKYLTTNGTTASWAVVSGSGSVTSVGLTTPSWLTVSGSPITTSGTLAVTGTSESANLFLASPDGSAGSVSPRAIVVADIPTLNQNTTGTASNITATSNSSLITLSSLSLPYSQVTGAPSSITALTGDVTASGPGSSAAKVANDQVRIDQLNAQIASLNGQ